MAEKLIETKEDENRVELGERSLEERTDMSIVQGNGWRDIFDKLTYSSGPSDNIYVYG